MQNDDERQKGPGQSRLGQGEPRFGASRAGRAGPFGRLVAAVVWAVILLAAFTFSLLLFAVVAVGGLLVGGWLWWKTRELRRQMRERPLRGRVIEGEVTRD